MNDDQREQLRKEAYEAFELAIEKMAALMNLPADEDDDTPEMMPIDAVLIIGSQYIDKDGDRCGAVDIAPRHGWQPGYITAGLLAMATARVTE